MYTVESATSTSAVEHQTLLSPLGASATAVRALCIAGAFALILTLVAVALDELGLAALTGSVGAGLLLLSFSAALLSKRQALKVSNDLRGLSGVLVSGPEPILATNVSGAVLATNPAARAQPSLGAYLEDWVIAPESVLDAMLTEVRRFGHSEKEYVSKNRSLRVVAHRSGGAGVVVVWRFSLTKSQPPRALEAVGLPILTMDDGRITGNAAARAFVGEEEIKALKRDAARVFSGGESKAVVNLPSGRSVHFIGGTGSDGLRDVVLMPQTLLQPAQNLELGADFDDIPVALLQLDREGRMSGTNRLARSLLALDVKDTRYFWQVVEGLGRPVADWLTDAHAGRALGRPEILRASLTGTETYVQIILRRVGTSDSDGQLVAIVSDATELKSLEARFVQSQKMQAIGQLAGGIAHDFNNLLTAISGHCDLLLINRDRFDPDYDDLLQIHQNANRAAALVRQLLAFSRKQTMKPETLRLESLLEELTHLLTRLVGERIILDLSHDPSLTAIRADRRQLEQVIMNLVVNARDAMPMGGTIRVETKAEKLEAELEIGRARVPVGDYAVIRVIDQGVGIPASIIDKIFEPFFTTKRLGEGTGLGLSTAYGIVKQMGGYIFAQSVEGSGTTFTLYFARLSAAALRAEQAQAGQKPGSTAGGSVEIRHSKAGANAPVIREGVQDGGSVDDAAPIETKNPNNVGLRHPQKPLELESLRSGSILLVEDEAPVRAFAARALRLQGYQVFEAQDGEQALEFLEDKALRIDLFVTDVIMPGIDGPGWVTRALVDRPTTPVVFVSGYTEDTLSEALSRIPRAIFLGKPFSLQDLRAAIEAQLTA